MLVPATAVQVIPRLAESAQEVYVFQRTPAAVGVRNQQDTDPPGFRRVAGRIRHRRKRRRNHAQD